MQTPRKMQIFIKKVVFNTPLRDYLTYIHEFYFTVPQLFFLCQCIEQVRELKGAIAEVGCATGRTTVFINKYMDARGIDKKYYAIDTFSGFLPEDIEFEVSKRQKKSSFYSNIFRRNMKKWFDYTMNRNGINRVVSIQADVNKYDLTTLGSLSFVLLDVDLYRPVKKSLPELYDTLTSNGIMIVDDCSKKDIRWDGADQAYREFMKEIKQPIQVVQEKLGVVRKA
jgi:O-methyltransferase